MCPQWLCLLPGLLFCLCSKLCLSVYIHPSCLPPRMGRRYCPRMTLNALWAGSGKTKSGPLTSTGPLMNKVGSPAPWVGAAEGQGPWRVLPLEPFLLQIRSQRLWPSGEGRTHCQAVSDRCCSTQAGSTALPCPRIESPGTGCLLRRCTTRTADGAGCAYAGGTSARWKP